MKTIIAEKPSVAHEIARIVKATKKENGYYTGNGYNVTWAFGHLVQPALPDGYGIKGFHRDNLPIIPLVFQLVPRQVKTDKGYKPDGNVAAQIKLIGSLFRKSERIIVATDAGREGELIFRYLYEYIGCATPFDRLWISSLTDKAIRKGLERLESGNKYDNLYYAAKARSEADWLVGINATQAITLAAGRGTYSLGRVQTPALAMVCRRFWENKRFTPEDVFQAHFSTPGNEADTVVKLSSAEKWKEKAAATAAYQSLKEQGVATVTKVERKETVQEAPLLYDLTTLQKEANTKHGFSADKTLSIAQKLYEAKLVTYPRMGSRYIPEDAFAEIPSLLAAMETAGKEVEDEEVRQSLKECGIGTPATRAAIIETLFSREYIVRHKKSLVPTEKGLALYSVVKQMRIADVEMTGAWEAALAKIERGELRAETFRKEIEEYTAEIVSELLTCDKLFTSAASECVCPKCKTGRMQFFGKVVRCDNTACGLPVFRVKAGKTLSDADIMDLLTNGRTAPIKGFNSKRGKPFSAVVAFDGDFNTVFEFPETKNGGKDAKREK